MATVKAPRATSKRRSAAKSKSSAPDKFEFVANESTTAKQRERIGKELSRLTGHRLDVRFNPDSYGDTDDTSNGHCWTFDLEREFENLFNGYEIVMDERNGDLRNELVDAIRIVAKQ